ncbi:F-box family protein [Euphorbia peplus]|nr:F-box family protein [Euphorbia peplus]WCJ30704.1 F-box family protein [Euphorbia peplus]
MAEESKQESSTSLWSELLPELLSQLSLHLYKRGDVGAVALISSVCKSWNNLMDMSYTASLIRTSLLPHPRPQLAPDYPYLFTISKGSLCKFFHPHHTFTMDFPELFRSCIQFSKFGWLLLRRLQMVHIDEDEDEDEGDYYSYFFFNPFTREKIELPPHEVDFYGMCFSAPPTCSDCYVIGFLRPYQAFGVIKRGEQEWTTYETNPKKNYFPQSHLVLYEDRCYAIGYENKTLVFDVGKEKIDWVDTLFPPLVDSHPYQNTTSKFLMSDGAQLLGVIRSHEQKEISIARWNESDNKWVDISSNHLRDKMLFLSKTSSLLLPAPVKEASNKVYFPKILNDASFVPYCVATTNYISFLGDYSHPTPWDDRIKEWPNCTWIETMSFVASPSLNRTIDW